MYALLDDASRRAYSAREFRRAYRDAAATATARRVAAGEPGGERDGTVAVPVDAAHARVRPRARPSCACP